MGFGVECCWSVFNGHFGSFQFVLWLQGFKLVLQG